jgi:putative exosortase-associated protein (TIGR04073 family)
MTTGSSPSLQPARRAARRAGVAGWILVAALVLAAVPAARASAADTAARKLGRGLAAMTCGFLEVPGNIVQMSRERGPAWGFTLGFVQGLGGIVVRELVGVYEFVTAPFPVPAGFKPIIRPEFPWGYFDEKPPAHS